MTAFAMEGREPAASSSVQLSPTVGYYIRKLLRQQGVASPVEPTADLGTVLRTRYRPENLEGAIASLERLVQYHQVLSSQGNQHQEELAQAEQDILQILDQPILEPLSEDPSGESPVQTKASASPGPSQQEQDVVWRIDEKGEERDKTDPLTALLAPRGYVVCHTRYNTDVLKDLGGQRPDVIVIDLKMSEHGIELCRTLRQQPELGQTPIVMVSSLHSVSDRLKALKLGVNDYLVQPVQPVEMLTRLENHLVTQRQRKQLEHNVQQLRSQLMQTRDGAVPLLAQAVLDQSGDYLLFINAQNQIVHVNETAIQLLGYSRDELLMLSMDRLDVRLAPQDWQTIWEHLRAHQALNLDSAHVTKAGETLDVQLDLQYLQVNGEEFSYLSAKKA